MNFAVESTTKRIDRSSRGLRAGICLLAMLGFVPGVATAQVASGPAAGTKVEPLKVVIAVGDNSGKESDLAEEQKGKPTVFVFVQADKWDRPVARFLRTLDMDLAKERTDVKIVAVWLTEDVMKSKDYLPKAQQSLKLTQTTWSVHPGEKGGPAGWGINADAHLTAIVVQENKVTASFGYRSVNETDVPAVIKELKPAK